MHVQGLVSPDEGYVDRATTSLLKSRPALTFPPIDFSLSLSLSLLLLLQVLHSYKSLRGTSASSHLLFTTNQRYFTFYSIHASLMFKHHDRNRPEEQRAQLSTKTTPFLVVFYNGSTSLAACYNPSGLPPAASTPTAPFPFTISSSSGVTAAPNVPGM